MAFTLDDLVACLGLTPLEHLVVEGPNLDIGYHRIFGGQILAQVVRAATGPEAEGAAKSVKSVHVLFPREGDVTKPMQYRISHLQDGRTFGTTAVLGVQGEKVIASATVSRHVDESGLHRSDVPPAVGRPDDAAPRQLDMIPWEVRVVGDVDLSERSAGPAELQFWMRAPALAGQPRVVHQALLAHATDLTLIGTALRPFDGVSQADSTITLHTAVTSHSLWFHQPFTLDEWLLVTQHSPVVANGRAFGRGDVFAGDQLVASFAQESMVRQVEPAS